MCKCLSNQESCLRSSSSLAATDQDLVNFKNSSEYKKYLATFKTVPQFDFARLLTYNNTIKQALFIPITQSATEKTVIIAFFDLLKQNFFAVVLESKGDLDNMVELSGTLNIYNVSKTVIFNGNFNDSKFIQISPVNPPSPNEVPFFQCLSDSVAEIAGNGAGSILCMMFPAECASAIVLHCLLQL